MKTFFVILLGATVILCGFLRQTKADVPKKVKAAISPVTIIDTKQDFSPYSWQTKWFKRDLNSRLNIKGMGDC